MLNILYGKFLSESYHDTDIRDFYVSESLLDNTELFDSITSSLCKNLNDTWILSSHGKEEIKLKPGEIVKILECLL